MGYDTGEADWVGFCVFLQALLRSVFFYAVSDDIIRKMGQLGRSKPGWTEKKLQATGSHTAPVDMSGSQDDPGGLGTESAGPGNQFG